MDLALRNLNFAGYCPNEGNSLDGLISKVKTKLPDQISKLKTNAKFKAKESNALKNIGDLEFDLGNEQKIHFELHISEEHDCYRLNLKPSSNDELTGLNIDEEKSKVLHRDLQKLMGFLSEAIDAEISFSSSPEAISNNLAEARDQVQEMDWFNIRISKAGSAPNIKINKDGTRAEFRSPVNPASKFSNAKRTDVLRLIARKLCDAARATA